MWNSILILDEIDFAPGLNYFEHPTTHNHVVQRSTAQGVYKWAPHGPCPLTTTVIPLSRHLESLLEESSHLADPTNVVLAFAAAYTQWEHEMNAADDGFNDATLQSRHASILLDYCTHKKRAYVDGIASVSNPPTYHQVVSANIDKTEHVSRSRVHVDTVPLDFHAYRFVVLKKTDGWRIDSVKWRFRVDGDWENTLIGS